MRTGPLSEACSLVRAVRVGLKMCSVSQAPVLLSQTAVHSRVGVPTEAEVLLVRPKLSLLLV